MNQSQFYRADIDGLRGLAVLGVLIFHGFPHLLTGGYAGVDVFFVISGFLISTILFQQMQKGHINLIEFFARRVRRLFPALLTVTLISLLFGWLVLIPGEFQQMCKHAFAGLTYFVNLVYWREAGYFNASSLTKPFLHLWSLSIEEQFYMIYPFLLIGVSRLRLSLSKTLIVVFGLSFLLCVSLTHLKPTFSFYSPVTRFWEMLAGCGLACLTFQGHSGFLNETKKRANLASVLGMICLAIGYFVLNEKIHFPGAWALIPVLSAFLLIGAGAGGIANQKILSHPALVAVGLISYPLYLWHWPILVYLKYLVSEGPQTYHIVLALSLSFVLAWLTYYFIERPLRHRSNTFALRMVGLSLILVLMSLLGWVGVWEPQSSNLKEIAEVDQATKDWKFPGSSRVVNSNGKILRALGSGPETLLFIGDSQIEQYLPRVERWLEAGKLADKTVLFATSQGCPAFPEVRRDNHFENCFEDFKKSLERAQQSDVKTVVIGSAWHFYFEGQKAFLETENKKQFLEMDSEGSNKAFEGLSKVIENLVKNNKRVFVVSGIPQGDEFEPLKMIRRSVVGVNFVPSPGLTRIQFDEKFDVTLKRVRLAALAAGAQIIEPRDYLCGDLVCPALDGPRLRYKDNGHLRASFVATEVEYMDQVL